MLIIHRVQDPWWGPNNFKYYEKKDNLAIRFKKLGEIYSRGYEREGFAIINADYFYHSKYPEQRIIDIQ